MSKIEQALEKAAKMRQSIKGPVSEDSIDAVDNKAVPPLPRFEIKEAVIDIELIDRHLVCITEPYSPSVEQYKKLWAGILKATAKDFCNTIMITSSDIGEGKSITAINLAAAMADAIDYTVLLVDADLRNPTIHRYLGIEPEYGLSDYLTGKADLSDVLIKTGIGKLVVLPAGNPTENPVELLSSDKMRMFVHEIKRRYSDRYIIFDSSPLLVTADSLSLSSFMDGIVFVIQALHTSKKNVRQALSLIKGSNIVGIVFNNLPQSLAKSQHPYYYPMGDKAYKKS